MLIKHIIAYQVLGGYNLPKDTDSQILIDSYPAKALLCKGHTYCSFDFDRRSAIASMLFTARFGNTHEQTFKRELRNEETKYAAQRQNEFGAKTILFIEISLDLAEPLSESIIEKEDFCSAIIKDTHIITANTNPYLEPIKLAFFLTTEDVSKFKIIDSLTLSPAADGRTIYFVQLSLPDVNFHLNRVITADNINDLNTNYSNLRNIKKLSSKIEVLTPMLDQHIDPYKRFILTWTAFETLITSQYSKLFSDGIQEVRSKMPELAAKIILSEDKENKTNPSFKFKLLIFSYAIGVAGIFEEEIKRLIEIYKLRNDLVHGSKSHKRELPVDELKLIYKKFLQAYLDHITPCSKA